MKVLVLYSQIPESREEGRMGIEFDMGPGVEGVVAALPGSVAVGVDGSLHEVVRAVEEHAPKVVFNLCEAPFGRPDREHHVAAVLEWRGCHSRGAAVRRWRCAGANRERRRCWPLMELRCRAAMGFRAW